jgi:hypothetical protein
MQVLKSRALKRRWHEKGVQKMERFNKAQQFKSLANPIFVAKYRTNIYTQPIL